VPVIRDQVTTLCGPGELIDVVITERGIAINPIRTDLIRAVRKSRLPLRTIDELKEESEKICGKPSPAKFKDKIVAVVKWVDGTLLDAVRQIDA
jgi:citrate lyase subunit alpha/citrate CoA-transferase